VKVISPLGEYDYRVERVGLRAGRLEVAGRLGQWETTMVVEPADLRALAGKAGPALTVFIGLWVVTRRLRRV
jgi:hypothetical protein